MMERAAPFRSHALGGTAVKAVCGDCFGYVLVAAKPKDKIVHGWVQNPWSKDRFWHAWIEKPSGRILDWQSAQGLGPGRRGWTRAAFMTAYAPMKTRAFTPEEARRCAIRARHAGPWTGKTCSR